MATDVLRYRRVTLKVCIGMVVLRPRELMKVINEAEHRILRFMDFWLWLWRDSPATKAKVGHIFKIWSHSDENLDTTDR